MSQEQTSTPISIRIVRTPCIRYHCVICGHCTYKCSVQAVAFEDDEECGKVCNACLTSPDVLKARARAHAVELRGCADALDAIEIRAMPSLADKQAAEEKADEEFREEMARWPEGERELANALGSGSPSAAG